LWERDVKRKLGSSWRKYDPDTRSHSYLLCSSHSKELGVGFYGISLLRYALKWSALATAPERLAYLLDMYLLFPITIERIGEIISLQRVVGWSDLI
jgi:hypothetical protein